MTPRHLCCPAHQHPIIIDAQAFGEGQEHHTLQPILETIQDRYQRLGLNENLYKDQIVVTADTGFANEANMTNLSGANLNSFSWPVGRVSG